jgi:hypothetical protein
VLPVTAPPYPALFPGCAFSLSSPAPALAALSSHPPTLPAADSGRPKGFGFIEFQDLRDAEEAIYHLDKTLFNGREIQVGAARLAAVLLVVLRCWGLLLKGFWLGVELVATGCLTAATLHV